MATSLSLLQRSYKAAGDLSTKQFYFVKFSAADTVDVCSALTDVPCGVLQNNPDAAGKSAEVMHLGISKVSADAGLSQGDLIGPSADGQADARIIGTDVTHYVGGMIEEAGTAAGDILTAFINCLAPHRAA